MQLLQWKRLDGFVISENLFSTIISENDKSEPIISIVDEFGFVIYFEDIDM